MKYKALKTQAGYIVQNTITYSVVAGPYKTEREAKAISIRLAGKAAEVVQEVEKITKEAIRENH